MTRLAWRSLRARPLRAILSTLGVALGVAVLVAGLTTAAGIDASVDSSVQAILGSSDFRVAAFDETGLTSTTVDTIANTAGVAVVAPALERRAYLGANPVGSGALPAPVTVLGVDPTAEARLHDLTVASGDDLGEGTEPNALVSHTLAVQDGLAVGSALQVQGAGQPLTLRVVGILADDAGATATAGRAVVAPLWAAQQAFAFPGVTRVDIGVSPGFRAGQVAGELQARLRSQPYVLSTPADLAAGLRASTADFEAMTALIAAVALFAGAFLIFNTLSMTVAERTREVGLLRAAGARRGQVTTFVLVQALVIGLAGSVVGVGLGLGLAAAMATSVGTVGSVSLDRTVVPALDLILAVGVGVLVTLAAALEPARRASRIQPVEALRPTQSDSPATRRARLRWLFVVFAAVAVVGVIAWPHGTGGSDATQAIAVYAVLLAATLLIPIILPGLARIAGLPFAAVARLEERLARGSIVRDRSRTTLTLGALTIGLAMVVAVGGVGQQARAAASAWIADVIPGDVVLTSIRPIAADEGVTGDLAGGPGVERVSPMAAFAVSVAGQRVDAAAVSGADLVADGRLQFVAGDPAAALAALDAGGATILPEALAQRLGVAVGGSLAVPTADGRSLALHVVGVVDRSIPGGSGDALLVGWSDATGRLGVAGADTFGVRFAPGAPATAHAALAEQATTHALEVVPLDRIEGAIDGTLGHIFSLFDALTLVAVLVAALGIVNTLTMNVIERVREIGILRAAGMTRGQVWRSVVVEAGVLGLSGSLLGVGLGLVVGGLMVILAGGRIDPSVGAPWSMVAFALVLGVGLAMLAAAYPAGLAARSSIVRTVQFE